MVLVKKLPFLLKIKINERYSVPSRIRSKEGFFMKTILFEEDQLIITLSSLETILGLKHTIEVPYSDISDVSIEDIHEFLWKIYGTHLGASKYGHFKKDGVNYFVATSTNKRNLVLTLTNHKYDKIIVELEHVEDVLQQIQNTLRINIK